MNPEQIEVMMRLRGDTAYQRSMQRSTAVTTQYGAAAQKAGMQAKAGAVGIDLMSKSGSKGVGALEKMKRVGQGMRSTGRSLSTNLTLPIVAAGAYAVHTAAEFEKSMAQVKVAGNVGGEGMASLEDLALKMGAETIFSANESGEAMLDLVKAGITPAQVKAGALGSTMALAATEGLALGRTAEIVGAAMNTFKIPAQESKLIADALAGGANASSASVQGLAQSLAQGGQSAAMYGINVHETVGALSAFAQNGIQASDAGTSFKTFLMRLNPVTKKAKEEMNRLGLDFFDADGKMISLAETSRELRDELGGMSDKQRSAALGVLFGTDAIRAANIVYSEGPKGIMKYVRATEKQGGAQQMANAQMKGLPGSIERLKGSLETAALVAGLAMAPAIELVAGGIEGLANSFSGLPPDVQTFIIIGLGVTAMIGPLVWVIGSLITAVSALGTALMFLALNPVGIVITATAALVVGFILLYTKVEWFRNAVDTLVSFIKANPWILLLLGPLPQLIGGLILLVKHFGWVKKTIAGVFNWIKDHWRLLAVILFGPVGLALVLIVNNFNKIKDAVGGAFDWIKNAVQNVLQWFKTSSLGKTIAAPFLWAKNAIVDALEWVIDKIEWVVDKLDWAADKAESLLGGDKEVLGEVTIKPGALGPPRNRKPGRPSGTGGRENRIFTPDSLGLGATTVRRRATGRREATVRPLRNKGGPTPIPLNPRPQNGAYKRTIRHEVPVKVEMKVGRRKFGEGMAMAMIDEEVNE